MTDPRSDERLARDEARYGRCPACGEVLTYDDEEELTFCPYERSLHPSIPAMVAVQSLPPNDDRRRFLVGATSVDGRSTTIEVVLYEPVGSSFEPVQVAERIARTLIAAGARRGTFHFSSAQTAPDSLGDTLATITNKGTSPFSSPPGG